MDDEWEEEEQTVVVELSGIISNDFLSKCGGTCKILDIDSEQPMMQVGPYVFAGEYEGLLSVEDIWMQMSSTLNKADAMGTCVLFEEEAKKGRTERTPDLKYKCHTVRKLMMQRIFLTEKKEGESSTAGSGDSAGQKETTCPESSQEEILNEDEDSDEQIATHTNSDLEDSAVG